MGRRCFALSQSEEGPRRGAGRYLPVLLSLVSTLATSINVVRANRTSQRCPYGYTYRWDRHLNTQSMPSTHTGLPQPPVRGVTFLQRVEAKQPAYRARDARISLPHPGVSRWPVAECRFVICHVYTPGVAHGGMPTHADTGEELCRVTPMKGHSTAVKDEESYLWLPPCQYGSAAEGLRPPPVIPVGTNLTSIKVVIDIGSTELRVKAIVGERENEAAENTRYIEIDIGVFTWRKWSWRFISRLVAVQWTNSSVAHSGVMAIWQGRGAYADWPTRATLCFQVYADWYTGVTLCFQTASFVFWLCLGCHFTVEIILFVRIFSRYFPHTSISGKHFIYRYTLINIRFCINVPF